MKKNVLISFLLFLVFLSSKSQNDPWQTSQLIKPAELAAVLKNKNVLQPLIFNVGPMSQIKGAVKIGSANEKAGLELLRTKLSGIPKDKEIIVYCGCCTSENCPNIRPAFNLLKELGYKKTCVLFIEHGFQEDWIGKDFPIE